MSLALLGGLAVLALIDSTSFGTLLIPLWFLLTPGRVRVRPMLTFLGTVAAFYLVVGLALVAGADAVLSRGAQALDHPAVAVAQLVLGVGLLVASFFIDRKGPDGERRPGRVLRWRDRAMGEGEGSGSSRALVGLALGAAVLEVATMLPYLAAIGLLTTADLPVLQRSAVLAAYCLVMVLPALVLLGLRLVARRRVEPVLARIAAWLERTGAETTAWVVGIVGVLVALDALERLPQLAGQLGISVG